MSAHYGMPCPAGLPWCEHDKNAPGDEHQEIGTYIPATASAAQRQEITIGGATFPTVAATIATDHGNPVPYIVLHVSGPRVDAEVFLQVHEAETLAAQLAERATIARGIVTDGRTA